MEMNRRSLITGLIPLMLMMPIGAASADSYVVGGICPLGEEADVSFSVPMDGGARGISVLHCVDIVCRSASGCGGFTITNKVAQCEYGWTLVMTPSPMCAHELKEPK